MANVSDIKRWLVEAQRQQCAYLVVMCDTFDYDYYPEFTDAAGVKAKLQAPGNMQRVIEIYDMSISIDVQLSERRAWHPPL